VGFRRLEMGTDSSNEPRRDEEMAEPQGYCPEVFPVSDRSGDYSILLVMIVLRKDPDGAWVLRAWAITVLRCASLPSLVGGRDGLKSGRFV
jgi:hypothetical protein